MLGLLRRLLVRCSKRVGSGVARGTAALYRGLARFVLTCAIWCRLESSTRASISAMRRLLVAILPLLLAAAPTTRDSGDDRVISLAEAKAREQVKAVAEVAGLPIVNVKGFDEVLKLSIKDNDLRLDTSLVPVEQALLHISNVTALTQVKFLGAADPGQPLVIVHYDLETRDYAVPAAICSRTSCSYAGGVLTLVQLWETPEDETYSITLIQNTVQQGEDDAHVTLYVQKTSPPAVDLTLKADNVVELRRKYPAEVAKYVDPVFRALHQDTLLANVDPKLAWQVFADGFTPAADLGAKVKGIVARLDADSFQTREAASRELEAVGEPAALLLMRQDRKGLSDEQTSRIDAFLAKFKVVPDAEAARLRKDREFLIDCLRCDEEPIRRLALAELRTVTGHAIEFDVTTDAPHRQAAVEKIRQSVSCAFDQSI